MLTPKKTQAYALIEKHGKLTYYQGEFLELENLEAFSELHKTSKGPVVFVTPFSVAKSKGFETQGDEPILAIKVRLQRTIDPDFGEACDLPIAFEKEITPNISDEDFAKAVAEVQQEEIGGGNASQVIISRKFLGKIEGMNHRVPLELFRRLLKQKGQYMTYLFSSGKGQYFVGASPERQIEMKGGDVIKNPIAGTMPKGNVEDFKKNLQEFLRDKKEINELAQVLDEELKMMAQICPKGGKIEGPLLRETGAVVHTEYNLVGHDGIEPIPALKESFHAPTLVGSPLESAFRIIKNREAESRRYYGGEFGVISNGHYLDSAILIRTAELDADGNIAVQAGAGVVRDSVPEKEAIETKIKSEGLIKAIQGIEVGDSNHLEALPAEELKPLLQERNEFLSKFHFEDQFECQKEPGLLGVKVTIINNEDNFARMIGHMAGHMGCVVNLVDTFDYDLKKDDSDIVVIGPGPGDINDSAHPRMKKVIEITDALLESSKPIIGLCLGHQALAKQMGMKVERQGISTQGLQREIDLFGKKEKVGFYNSFSPLNENVPADLEIAIDDLGRVVAFKKEGLIGIQFHPESVMTQNGYDILKSFFIFLNKKPMMTIDTIIEAIKKGDELNSAQVDFFVEESVNQKLDLEHQKAFLLALNEKGYSAKEVAAFVQALYERMPVALDLPGAIDICGTGGSGLPRINTSTISAFVLAAEGIPIAKHGNKAASGRFGSFDLLEAMGINIMNGKDQLEFLFETENLAFIFARAFHPIMKHFGPVRAELGVKTIFNILGPLLNPSHTEVQVVGTSKPEDQKLIIEAAKILGKKKFMVLNGSDGLDEVTLTGKTHVAELKDGEIEEYDLTPEDFGFETVDFDAISGGDKETNLRIANEIITRSCKTAHLNLVVANSALILKFMDKVKDLKEGVKLAKELIAFGKAEEIREVYIRKSNMPDILKEIAEHKKEEVIKIIKETKPEPIEKSDRDFKAAFASKDKLNVIAEIKYASPSDKDIGDQSIAPEEVAKIYEAGGAAAISVLTDEKYFKGSLENLTKAREATSDVPLLMKDFFINASQVHLARRKGADAILLIAAILSNEHIDHLIDVAKEYNMDALVEVHTEEELDRVLQTKAEIIGINNRNLHTFEIDNSTFFKLASKVPADKILIAESGYTENNVNLIKGIAHGVLVGTSLMKAPDTSAALDAFMHPHKTFKACGVRTKEAAEFCQQNEVSLVGLNFVPKSHRSIDLETAKELRTILKAPLVVGVFQDEDLDKVNEMAHLLDLDFVQLSGEETPEYCAEVERPVIKTIKVGDLDQIPSFEPVVSSFIIDGKDPGSGEGYDYSMLDNLKLNKPYLIAGGVNIENVENIEKQVSGNMGFDSASGIETDRKVDIKKIEKFKQLIK